MEPPNKGHSRDKPSGLCREDGPCWEVCVKHPRFDVFSYIPIINLLSAILTYREVAASGHGCIVFCMGVVFDVDERAKNVCFMRFGTRCVAVGRSREVPLLEVLNNGN